MLIAQEAYREEEATSASPLTSMLLEIADLETDSFEELKNAVEGPNALDSEKERVAILSPAIGLDTETTTFVLTALNYFDFQINRTIDSSNDIPDAIPRLVDAIIERDKASTDDKPSEEKKAKLVDRLRTLFDNHKNIEKYNKHERLRWGFLPAATGFSTFVDLRPNLSDDLTAIEELIPIIQFSIRTDSTVPELQSLVFQLDPRSLKRLRDEVERAERKLSNIQNHESLKNLMTKRQP